MSWQTSSTGSADTERLGRVLGSLLKGGEVIELRSDLGGGKTTFARGLARGAGSRDTVSSPTFTLNKIYRCKNNFQIHHFDFYRLSEPGVIAEQLAESLNNPKVAVVIEWGGIVKNVLPKQRLSINLKPTPNNPEAREVTFRYPVQLQPVVESLRTKLKEVEP